MSLIDKVCCCNWSCFFQNTAKKMSNEVEPPKTEKGDKVEMQKGSLNNERTESPPVTSDEQEEDCNVKIPQPPGANPNTELTERAAHSTPSLSSSSSFSARLDWLGTSEIVETYWKKA